MAAIKTQGSLVDPPHLVSRRVMIIKGGPKEAPPCHLVHPQDAIPMNIRPSILGTLHQLPYQTTHTDAYDTDPEDDPDFDFGLNCILEGVTRLAERHNQ